MKRLKNTIALPVKTSKLPTKNQPFTLCIHLMKQALLGAIAKYKPGRWNFCAMVSIMYTKTEFMTVKYDTLQPFLLRIVYKQYFVCKTSDTDEHYYIYLIDNLLFSKKQPQSATCRFVMHNCTIRNTSPLAHHYLQSLNIRVQIRPKEGAKTIGNRLLFQYRDREKRRYIIDTGKN